MSLMDLFLNRRLSRKPTANSVHLCIETLEDRQCPAVTAPTGLTLTALAPTQVKLTWNDVAGELGYRVYRWDGAQAIQIGQVAANIKTFTVSNLAPNSTQWFAVQAFNSGSTAQSAWAAVQTPPNAITAPANVRVVSTTQTSATLQWGFATNATGYRIYGWDGARAILQGTVGATVNSFVVGNLSPGGTYYFYVQSFNATNSATSAWVTASTGAIQITAPSNLKATTVSASTIGLSWNDSLNETGYRVFRWDGNSANAPIMIATLAANVTGYQAIGLLPGRTYSFYVQAFNATSSANSVWVQGATAVAIPLQAPTITSAVVSGPNSVFLTWTSVARAVGYRVFMWNGAAWSPAMTVIAGNTQATVSGLAAFRTHWFMIEAYTDNFAEVKYSTAVFVNL